MARLSRYLARLFWSEAMALFAVAAFLLFLIQCLRLFDLVSDKGQNVLTLVGQALLTMPGLGVAFLYVCLGIGLGRALRRLQASSELGIIHSNGLLPALLRAIGLYTLIGTLGVLLLSHVADPLGSRVTNDWSTSIAADLVSRSMIPHRFTSLGGGVSMVIGGRDSRGNISDFFADDPRDPDSHRTYFARAAIITHDEQGYVLRMRDGAVQYLSADGRFSQVAFKQYDLPMDQLAADAGAADGLGQTPSYDLVATALETGHWDPAVVKILLKRSGEGLRVLALCALVAALALFPSGRRRADAPVEIAVLGAAFIERALTSYIVGPGIFSVASGSVIILIGAAAILCVRLRVFRPIRWRRRAAA
ncbi:MAG: LptF/LptG family permease [Devosia sp.]|jgi:lipopolysaccharide export system permease protein|nr:LptF/LptG family permease [Devosia sp.]